jgi:hypothetical protein
VISYVTPSVVVTRLATYDIRRNNRGITPNLLALAQQGTLAKKFEPVFPIITFPNHYALVTERYPDHNGMVNNTMYDPARTDQVFRLSDRHAIENPLWWGGRHTTFGRTQQARETFVNAL